MPGVETMLPVLLDRGVNAGRMTLEQLVGLCCENPARTFGLYPRKGTLQVGGDADIVIVDLEKEDNVDLKNMHDVYAYSAYDGWKIKGWPTMTIVRGSIVMENRTITGEAGYGNLIAASRPMV
jgi:dihydropyrimidinase